MFLHMKNNSLDTKNVLFFPSLSLFFFFFWFLDL